MPTVLHCDLDAFFASVEQMLRPGLIGKPVAVSAGRGQSVITAASYEARAFGVRAGMPLAMARELCPRLVFLPARMEAYRACGDSVQRTLARSGAVLESLGVDECYLEVAGVDPTLIGAPADADPSALGHGSLAWYLAKWAKEQVRERYGLTLSVGGGRTKTLAKLASDRSKPDGLLLVPDDEAITFLDSAAVEEISGIGPRIAERLAALGVRNVAELRTLSMEILVRQFGRHTATFLYELCRNSSLEPVTATAAAKSMSAQRQYRRGEALSVAMLEERLNEVLHRLEKSGQRASRIVVFAVTATTLHQRRIALGGPSDVRELARAGRALYPQMPLGEVVYLCGVGVTELSDVEQLTLEIPVLEEVPDQLDPLRSTPEQQLGGHTYRGMRVRHPVFGEGVVEELESDTVAVTFKDRRRRLALWAPLTYDERLVDTYTDAPDGE